MTFWKGMDISTKTVKMPVLFHILVIIEIVILKNIFQFHWVKKRTLIYSSLIFSEGKYPIFLSVLFI